MSRSTCHRLPNACLVFCECNSDRPRVINIKTHIVFVMHNNCCLPWPVEPDHADQPPEATNMLPTGSVSRQGSIEDLHSHITLSWKNINVWAPPQYAGPPCRRSVVQSEKHILKEVTGLVKPGSLVAILGASGAGKSTLLNVLNYRNRGNLQVTGEVRVNGEDVGPAISKISAYVQQDDLFIASLKVKEHLWFTAQLRMAPDIPKSARLHRVYQVMMELGLTKCADTVIGKPGETKGISGGERKRLAFASEVLTDPPLLFCDEPTSGLDAFMAQNVIQTVKALAAKGKTILCTIHQPSSETYAMFDDVLLMAEGRTAFMGLAKDAGPFFASAGYECPVNFNPADHYIHTLAVIPGNESNCRELVKQVCDQFSESDAGKVMKEEIARVHQEQGGQYAEEVAYVRNQSPYRASWGVQFSSVVWRCWLTNIREPMVMRARFAQAVVIGLLLGIIYLDQPYDQKGVQNINGVLFLLQLQMSFGNMFAVVNVFPLEFPVYLREHHNGMYRVDIYYLSKMLAELPTFILQPIVFVAITYWMTGLNEDAIAFLIASGAIILTANISISFGYLISCATSSVTLALSVAPIVMVPLIMFGGFFLNAGSVPVYLVWLKYLSWFNYCNEILVVNQWTGVQNITCEFPAPPFNTTLGAGAGAGGRCFTTGEQVIESLSYSKDNLLLDWILMIVLFFAFRIIAFILLLLRSRKTK